MNRLTIGIVPTYFYNLYYLSTTILKAFSIVLKCKYVGDKYLNFIKNLVHLYVQFFYVFGSKVYHMNIMKDN